MAEQNIRAVIAALADKATKGEGEPPMLGHEAAEKMELLSSAAAEDVALLGKAVMEVATRIDMECRDLATTMLDHGQFVARHIRSFAALVKEVGLRNRETRQHITGESVAAPSTQGGDVEGERSEIELRRVEGHQQERERITA
jgi:hypothetical protein